MPDSTNAPCPALIIRPSGIVATFPFNVKLPAAAAIEIARGNDVATPLRLNMPDAADKLLPRLIVTDLPESANDPVFAAMDLKDFRDVCFPLRFNAP